MQLLIGFIKNAAECAKLRLDRTEELPDIAGPLLDRKCAEAHLQTVEQGCECSRACQCDAIFTLKCIGKARPPQNLCVQALCRQEHNGKIRRMRRIDILGFNRLRLKLDALFKLAYRLACSRNISRFLRLNQSLIILQRKLRINGHPDKLLIICLGRQLDRKLHAVRRSFPCSNVRFILLGCQGLLKQVPELNLPPIAACLHIGQHLFQIADARG
ncbi:hypothetical protein D3C81_653110 [compost metagenome]